jgi:thioredoxin 1
MKIDELSDSEFQARLTGAKSLFLVDFWATWCAPCKMLNPTLERFAAAQGGAVEVVKIDIDACKETAAKFGVKSAPTLILFRDGEMLELKRGLQSKGQLDKWIAQHAVCY